MPSGGRASPVRQCVGCRKRLPQAALLRFVSSTAGWMPDGPGRRKRPGRGAYLCSADCVRLAAKNKRYRGLATAAAEYGLISSSNAMKND